MISLLHLFLWLLVLYVGLMALMYVFQRKLVFRPYGTPFGAYHAPFTPWPYQTSDGLELRGFWHPPQSGKPTILFFQGNGSHLGYRLFKMVDYQRAGYGIAMVGYRGYNGNPGKPSEHGLYIDARSALAWLNGQGIKTEDIILYGESLGSGVATQMAIENPTVKALILEAPYTSIVDVASYRYPIFPVGLLVQDRFDSVSKIHEIQTPLFIMHGTADSVVPYRFGVRLFKKAQAPLKRLMTIEDGDHSTLYNDGTVSKSVMEFINGLS